MKNGNNKNDYKRGGIDWRERGQHTKTGTGVDSLFGPKVSVGTKRLGER